MFCMPPFAICSIELNDNFEVWTWVPAETNYILYVFLFLHTGAIYDLRKSYDDVFYVVGAIYVVDAFIFAGIPLMDKYREARGLKPGPSPYEDIDAAAIGEHTQTFRITKRSLSKSSLVNGEAEGVNAYGTTGTTQPPPKPPPPDFSRQESFGNGGIRPSSNPFRQESGTTGYATTDTKPSNPFLRQDSGSSKPPVPNRPAAPYSGYGSYDQ